MSLNLRAARRATAWICALLAAHLTPVAAAGQTPPAPATPPSAAAGDDVTAAGDDVTAAERALFLEPSLKEIKPPRVLDYRFARTGTLEAPFDDKVTLKLAAQPGGGCCAATVDFLTGSNTVKLPELDLADANPVLLGFLEQDIREMERLTGGKANYFRKRIRMALAEGPPLTPRTLRWQGRDVAGVEISITPYRNDPMRARYDKFADKRYVFWRSAAVPGRLFGARSVVPAAGQAAPLVTQELWLAGAQPVLP